jgi:TRAP-type mannitol/chloroaromatic compound transport system permease small subunit
MRSTGKCRPIRDVSDLCADGCIAVVVSDQVCRLSGALWTLEFAQFIMVGYYLLGGAYSMQMGDHVRMDLIYGMWSPRRKAAIDAMTVLFLLFYLCVLLYGGISSTTYAIEYGERAHSVWRPYMWPVKLIAVIGVLLMLLQTIAELFRDILYPARCQCQSCQRGGPVSYELIALFMFAAMMALLLTGQRVFGVIGAVAVIAALPLWGTGGVEIAFTQSIKLMKWYPLLTLPMFIFMGYMLSESRIADDLYRMFHVWFGPVPGGLAIGTILLMVVISAMNGLSVAGMAIGATIALPELLQARL